MRPLLYSEREARSRGLGWHRTGHHITYHRNVMHLQSGVLPRDMALFVLEWQMVMYLLQGKNNKISHFIIEL